MLSERQAVKFIARFAPWLAPVPSAWLVGRAVLAHLAFPLPVAVVTAAIVETLGLVSVFNWQYFADWNRRKLKSDTPAPTWIPAALGIFYLAVTVGLVVILDVLPWLATYAPAALPLLALVGTVNLALFAGQEHREAQADAARQERKNARQEGKGKQARQGPRKRKARASRQGKASSGTRQAVLDIYASDPQATQAQIAEALGVSRQAIGQHLGKLEEAGLIERNGQGVVVK